MKLSVILSVVSVVVFSAAAQAEQTRCESFRGEVNYTCIADSLEAINSDIYYNLSNQEIDELLSTCNTGSHDLTLEVAKACEKK